MEPLQDINKNNCDFCQEIAGRPPNLLGLPTSTLSTRIIKAKQAEDLFVIPDASPISKQHGLLIPQKHISRFSEFDCSRLAPIVRHATNFLTANETLIFFEHGGHSCLRNKACSEHAHFHLVTVNGFCMSKFLDTLSQFGGKASNSYYSINSIFHSALPPDSNDYLIFGFSNRAVIDIRVIYFDYVPSQVLRYVLADSLGISPHIESQETRLEAFLSSYRWLEKLFQLGSKSSLYDTSRSLVCEQ